MELKIPHQAMDEICSKCGTRKSSFKEGCLKNMTPETCKFLAYSEEYNEKLWNDIDKFMSQWGRKK